MGRILLFCLPAAFLAPEALVAGRPAGVQPPFMEMSLRRRDFNPSAAPSCAFELLGPEDGEAPASIIRVQGSLGLEYKGNTTIERIRQSEDAGIKAGTRDNLSAGPAEAPAVNEFALSHRSSEAQRGRNGGQEDASPRRFGIRHPGGLHTGEDILRTRKLVAEGREPWTSAYRQFRTEARKSLEQVPHAVEMFIIPPFADDYSGYMDVCQPFMDDAFAAYSCALAYQLESDPDSRKRYAGKALEILNAWGRTNKGFKARAESYHRRTGWKEPFVRYQLVSSSYGVGLIFGAELMMDYEGWKQEDRARFARWVNEVYRPEADGIQAWETGTNWVCWGTLASIASAHLVGEEKERQADIGRIKWWIEKHIAEDGHLPAEMARGEAGMWYTYFALAPMTAACRIAYNATGVDLFHYKAPNGRSMKLALDYLFKSFNGPSGWPTGRQRAVGAAGYLTKGSFPGIWWGANLFEAMSAVYGDERYDSFVAPARPVTMTARHHYAWNFPTLMRPMGVRDGGAGGPEKSPGLGLSSAAPPGEKAPELPPEERAAKQLLEEGERLLRDGDLPAAKAFFERVRDLFPETKCAEKAKKHLEQMK